MLFPFRKTLWVFSLLVLGQGGNVLQAGLLKNAAAAAAVLALLVSGEPWLPQAAPVDGLAPGAMDFNDQAGFLAEAAQGCSEHCGREFQVGTVRCETQPGLLRNYCLTRILAENSECMAKCLGEAGVTSIEASQ